VPNCVPLPSSLLPEWAVKVEGAHREWQRMAKIFNFEMIELLFVHETYWKCQPFLCSLPILLIPCFVFLLSALDAM